MRLLCRLFLVCCFLLPLAGCPKPVVEPAVKPGAYQNSPEELKRLWGDILYACQKDDRGRVHDLMASFIMTPAELESLLGKEQSKTLGPRYLAMLGSLVNAGAVELVAHIYEKKYDDIAVNRIDTLPDAEKTDTDRNVALALQKTGAAQPFYTVRVKRRTETRGLRYDFFVYLNGYWRSGNLLGKFLPPAPPLAPAAPPPDAGVQAPDLSPAATKNLLTPAP
jgi:hypothetical protein